MDYNFDNYKRPLIESRRDKELKENLDYLLLEGLTKCLDSLIEIFIETVGNLTSEELEVELSYLPEEYRTYIRKKLN